MEEARYFPLHSGILVMSEVREEPQYVKSGLDWEMLKVSEIWLFMRDKQERKTDKILIERDREE